MTCAEAYALIARDSNQMNNEFHVRAGHIFPLLVNKRGDLH